jgi:outer membrane assembly lipoprotein YfiO
MGLDPGAGLKRSDVRLLAAAVLAVALGPGCAHRGPADIATLASNNDQEVFEAGQKAYEKKNWESARQHFKRIVDGFPQSQYGPDARLALAESYFKEGGTGNMVLATSAYRDFLTLYPSHPKSDYAQYQVAECFFNQKNGPDRDQTNTEKALAEYQRLLETYPASSFTEPARGRIRECRQSLARAEYLAGFFYQRTRRAYRSAILRYEGLLNEFPDYQDTDEVLFRLAQCLSYTGRGAEALPQLDRLLSEYPQSGFVGEAQQLQTELAKQVAPPPPPPQPAEPPPPAKPQESSPPSSVP